MSFIERLESASNSGSKEGLWKGTFREFLALFEAEKEHNKNIGVLSHQRVYNMVMASGTSKEDHFGQDRTSYSFFENTLFGLEESISDLMSYFHSAAQKTETSRRMLLMYGPPSSGKCLAGDTEVYDCTTGQMVRIDDIVENGRRVTVCAFNEDNKTSIQSIKARQCNGVRKTYSIKTSLGREIKATANHKFLTYDGWKTVGELSSTDRIAIPRILPEPMKILAKSLEEVRFCAYMIGEGNCVNRISFTNTEDIIRSEFTSDSFVLSHSISPDLSMSARKDGIALRTVKTKRTGGQTPNPLKQWLVTNKLWGKLATEKECPSFVFQLPNVQLGVFLGRLYSCDGHISGNTINYCTASRKLAQNMVTLLSRLGIMSKFRYKEAKCRNQVGDIKSFDSWQLDVTDSYSVENFKEHIAPHLIGRRLSQFNSFWQVFSNKVHRGNIDVFPAKVRRMIKSEMKSKGMKLHSRNYREPGLYMLRTDSSTRNISRRKISAIAEKIDSAELRKLTDSDVCYDKIMSIDVDEHVKVYDIEVPRYHNFVANGIVTHNSDIVQHLKRGLESYTKTDEGAIYALVGTSMHENPFLLIPEDLRPEFEEKFGLRIEGRLSPYTALILREDFKGKFMDYPVQQIWLDEAQRRGIGTWLPQDPKCLTCNCTILSGNGVMKGKDLFLAMLDGDKPVETVIGTTEEVTLKDCHFNGLRPVYEISPRGMSIEATANHRFLALNEDGDLEFVKTKNIQGRCVPLKIGSEVFGTNIDLEHIDECMYNESHHFVHIPSVLSLDLARMVGYLVSEGYCGDNHIRFCNQDRSVNLDYQRILANEFLLECPIAHKKRDLLDESRDVVTTVKFDAGIFLSKSRFVDFINLNFQVNAGACEKEIPSKILQAPKKYQIEFLEALFIGDGTTRIRKNTPHIKYASCSKSMISQLQSMLINLGTYGTISSRRDKKYSKNLQYSLTMEGDDALSLAGLLPKFMKHRKVSFENFSLRYNFRYESFGSLEGLISQIREATRGTRDIIDRRYMTKTTNRRSPSRRSLNKWLNHLESTNCQWTDLSQREDILKKIRNLLNHRFLPVVQRKYIGMYPVFDLEVDNPSHVFVANGLYSHNSSDQSELVGSIDFSKIQEYGDEGDPRAYNFNGELNVANRGIMEFIEGLKADERFLRVLLTATQEKAIKAPRYGLIYCDSVIILHTNEEEFRNFMSEKKYEAYHDRMVIVKVPYNLSVSNEVKIYEKLLSGSDALNGMNIAPKTLEAAAMFAVLSRLSAPPEGGDLTLIKKMKLYDHKHVKGYKVEQVPDMKRKSVGEGMSGVSPRFIIDQISAAISTARDEERDYITALDVLRKLNRGIFNRDTFKKEQKNHYEALSEQARKEYDDMLRNDIQKAFFVSYEAEARNLCENYLDHIQASCSNEKPRDPVTGDEIELDDKLMDAIEEQIDISESGKEDFRNEILRAVATAARKGKKFDYIQHADLRVAIQKKLFEERKNVIRMTVSTRNPDKEELKRINDVIARMVDQQGYSEASANALLKYATAHLFDK